MKQTLCRLCERKGAREGRFTPLFGCFLLKIPTVRNFPATFSAIFLVFEQHILHEHDILCTSTCGRICGRNRRSQNQPTQGFPEIPSLILIYIKVVDLWRSHFATLPHWISGWWPGWWKPFESMTWLRAN